MWYSSLQKVHVLFILFLYIILLILQFMNFYNNIILYHTISYFFISLQGGVAFITIKGAVKIYHKQQQYKRQCQRRVMDYTDSNVALYRRQQDSESDRS